MDYMTRSLKKMVHTYELCGDQKTAKDLSILLMGSCFIL